MEKRAFEETGLVPRSIIRTFDRFRRQLLNGAETSVIQEFRVSRYQVLVSVKCLVSLLIIPLVVNFLAKTFFLMPLTEYLWNTQQNEIFLNLYQENRAFSELHDFEEKLFFESLIETQTAYPFPEKFPLTSSSKNDKFYKTEVKNNTNVLHNSLVKSKIFERLHCPEVKATAIDCRSFYFEAMPSNLAKSLQTPCLSSKPLLLPPNKRYSQYEEAPEVLLFTSPEKTKAWSEPSNICQSGPGPINKNKVFVSSFMIPNKETLKRSIAPKVKATAFEEFEEINCPELLLGGQCKENCVNNKNSIFSPNQAQLIESVNLRVFETSLSVGETMRKDGHCETRLPSGALTPKQPFYLENSLTQKFQQKTIELAIYYNQQSIEAITNLFGDFITFITITFLFIWMEPQIIILKSFLTESIYSLSDTTKSFLLILLTDLLVGFHSPRGWEIFIELILRRFGLPENQDFVFLFVATFPVLLDTVFKYWIFRYLNQISPSTVVTYHNMIE